MQKIVVSLAVAGLVAALIGAGATGARAQTTLGPITTTTPISLTKTDFTGGLTFTKFDSSLGTLLSVQLNVSSNIQTTITVQNNAASNSNGKANTQVTVSIYDAGGYLTKPGVDAFGDPVPGAYNVAIVSPNFIYNLAPGASTTSNLLTKSGSQSQTFTNTADAAFISQFVGNAGSTITLGVGTDTRTLLTNNGGNTDAVQVTKASATGTITYTYTPAPPPPAVPEPGMMAFALSGGAGLAGMVVRGRRRAKNA